MSDMTPITPTLMQQEVREIPAALQRMMTHSDTIIQQAARQAMDLDPAFLVTIARGSSDHCAAYLKYAFEIQAGLPVASIGPSIASVYGQNLKLANSVALSVSQSGQSPDIVAAARMSRSNGSLAIAITNEVNSPLAEVCNHAFDISAGPEKSVAATKTFVTSLVAGLLFLAHFREDQQLLDAIKRLPDQCKIAVRSRWDALLDYMKDRDSLYVLGRGPAFAIAHEVALKFKETCQIHAEAYSTAEVMHGPVSIVGEGFPVLALINNDAAQETVRQSISAVEANGAKVFAQQYDPAGTPDFVAAGPVHPLTEPVLSIVSFYAFVEELARLRGNNPDLPPNLRKVTETI
ncbi:MAG: SIS domain-containing protein [Rhizobiaceae bacterium]